MRILLDTCTFLWAGEGSSRLSSVARGILDDQENDLFLSAASAWEIAIKHALGDLERPRPGWL
jgi:PIN domain nuclease of toxin-antitoxin system